MKLKNYFSNTLIFGMVLLSSLNLFGQSPGGVNTGLGLWLKADAGTGSIATSWGDQSGLSNDYITVLGPTVQTNVLNYNDGIEILSGGFNAPLGAVLTADHSLFFVSKKLASDNNGRIFEGNETNYLWGHHGVRRNGIYLKSTSDGVAIPADHGGSFTTTLGIEDLHLHTYTRESGGGLEARTDGESLHTYTGTNNPGGVHIDINTGANTSENSDSRIGEMLVYTSQLSAADINKVESYLGVKYSISLFGDYTASDNTKIWDATLTPTYQNGIIGIGKDNSSALVQKQSRSTNDSLRVYIDALAAGNTSNSGAISTNFSFLMVGNDNNALSNSGSVEFPTSQGLESRIDREWKITNTKFAETFSLDFKLISTPTDASLLRLLVDSDGNFSDATVLNPTITISGGVVTVSGLTSANFPLNATRYITLSTMKVPKPGGVSPNISLWLRADGAGTTTEGQAVPTWLDKSGSTNNATAVTGAKYRGNVFNYNPTLEIDADNMDLTYLTPSFTNQDFYCVANNKSGATFNGYDGLLTTTTAGQTFIFLGKDGASSWYNGGGSIRSGTRYTDGSNSLELIPLINQYLISGDFSASSTEAIYIGSDRQLASDRIWRGNIAEIVAYSAGNSAAERQKIESYLAIKYGITLSTNYTNSAGTDIYNVSTYSNNIIGIERDDNSGGLLQKQSHSIVDSTRLYLSTLTTTNASNSGSFPGDLQSLVMGDDNDSMYATGSTEFPIGQGIFSRIDREWKITATNFTQTFSLDFKLATSPIDVSHIRILSDTDGDFSDATVLNPTITFSGGVLTVSGLTVANNTDTYITIASLNSSTPLPVELMNFNGELENGVVNLKWNTVSEMNNDYFDVLRSNDLSKWESIGSVAGAGNSMEELEYNFTDKSPLREQSYYRLKQVDFNGEYSFSNVVNIGFSDNQQPRLYPNPAKNSITIVASQKVEESEIRIYNNLGENLMNKVGISKVDEITYRMNISLLPEGTYTLWVNGKASLFVKMK